MTREEKDVIQELVQAWNAFLLLPVMHPDDTTEFRHLIHACQDKILSRVGRRAWERNNDAS